MKTDRFSRFLDDSIESARPVSSILCTTPSLPPWSLRLEVAALATTTSSGRQFTSARTRACTLIAPLLLLCIVGITCRQRVGRACFFHCSCLLCCLQRPVHSARTLYLRLLRSSCILAALSSHILLAAR